MKGLVNIDGSKVNQINGFYAFRLVSSVKVEMLHNCKKKTYRKLNFELQKAYISNAAMGAERCG